MKKKLPLFLLSLGFILQVSAQEHTVNGTIKDENNHPLQGVTISVKGTAQVTTTSEAGTFAVKAPAGATLVITYVGYQKQEVKTSGDQLQVALAPAGGKLDDVVVVGYGQQSRKALTTSIAKVSGKDIGIQPVSTPGDALAGLAPGVQVQSGRGGSPGAPPVIRVRGVGSIGGSNDVLYVVDGYPLQNASNFNQINPADIESMEILKDAASAAIYGSRAANGVVIVTTKRGKAGKVRFDVNAYRGQQTVAKRYEMMDKEQYTAFAKKVAAIRKVPYPQLLDNPSALPDTDWQDLIFRAAQVEDYQLTATGGSPNTRYLLSGGYFNQEGTLKGTGYKRYTLRFNLDADLSQKLKVGVSMAPSFSQQLRVPATGQWNNTTDGDIGRSLPNVLQGAYLMPPVIAPHTANGDYGQPNAETATAQYGFFQTNLFNPLATIERVKNRVRNYSFLGNSFLEWSPVKDLKLKTSLGATFDYASQYGYIPPDVATNDAGAANISTPVISNVWSVEKGKTEIDWLWENTAHYKLSLGAENQHNLTFLGFASAQRYSARSVSTNGKIGTYSNQTVQNPSASTDLQGGLGYDENAFVSLGGRVTYDLWKKYLFTAALRRDGSSKFGPDNRFSLFPSVSAAWRVIDEAFLKDAKSVLSDLKLRLSYGETGNANIGSFTWANSIRSSNYVFGSARNTGAQQSGLANHDLTWEKNRQYNLGLDLGLLHNRVVLGADYYLRQTGGMLLDRDLPGIYGYALTSRTNMGSLENRGLELSLNTNLPLGKINWNADYNFSTNANKVTSLGGPAALPSQSGVFGWGNMYQVVVGQPLGNINGFIVEGVFKNAADLAKYPQWNGNGNLVGDWRIRDVSGDGRITEADRTLLGNALPRYTYSSTQRFSYKNLDLTVMLQGVADVSILNGNYRQLYYGVVGLGGNVNMPVDVIDNFFDPANADKDVKFHRVAGNTGVTMNNQATNYSVLDASFLRVRNLTLGYRLAPALTSRLKLQNARVYLTGQNLFTFTKYPGVNPEASVAGNGSGDSPFLPGIDHGSYPAIRTVTLGVNIGF
ncbi:TonB-dependent receptor [Paraflavisolibacter sp. H34]|uniref:SusC/RagA family TonB-linked outer membrane protein n=1 Tax=Huijunlia imazamoxiresistens TaxID=3127457 RepID=UPI003017693C